MNEIVNTINSISDESVRSTIKQLLVIIQQQARQIESLNRDLDNLTNIVGEDKPTHNTVDLSDVKLQIKKLDQKIDRELAIQSDDLVRYLDNTLCEQNARIHERLMIQDGKIHILTNDIGLVKSNTNNSIQRIKDDVSIKTRDIFQTTTHELKKIQSNISTPVNRSKSNIKYK